MHDYRVVASDGMGFIEGPVFADDGTLYITSITKGGVFKVSDEGIVTLFADTGGGGNGAAVGDDGVIFVAQNGRRRVSEGPVFHPVETGIQRVDPSGVVSWLTQDPITPNDLAFGPDGMLYVTDPTRTPKMNDGRMWRIDPITGAAELLESVSWFPNGIAVGPDDRIYVGDTRDGVVYAGELTADGQWRAMNPVLHLDNAHPDGLAFDECGNILACSVDFDGGLGSVQTYSLDGRKLDEFSIGRGSFPTNLAFHPRLKNTLVVTFADLEEVLYVDWACGGLQVPPFR